MSANHMIDSSFIDNFCKKTYEPDKVQLIHVDEREGECRIRKRDLAINMIAKKIFSEREINEKFDSLWALRERNLKDIRSVRNGLETCDLNLRNLSPSKFNEKIEERRKVLESCDLSITHANREMYISSESIKQELIEHGEVCIDCQGQIKYGERSADDLIIIISNGKFYSVFPSPWMAPDPNQPQQAMRKSSLKALTLGENLFTYHYKPCLTINVQHLPQASHVPVSKASSVNVINQDAIKTILDELNDPIELDFFADPVATPYGRTYSKNQISQWLHGHNDDPLTREPLLSNQLVPNHLVGTIVDFAKKHMASGENLSLDLSREFMSFFVDPISRIMITNPVLAPDGNTYDHDTVAEYLRTNNNRLPNGRDCTQEMLIRNRVVENILAACRKSPPPI